MAAAASLPSATLRTTRFLPRNALPAANTAGMFVWYVPAQTSMPRPPTVKPQPWTSALSTVPQATSTASNCAATVSNGS